MSKKTNFSIKLVSALGLGFIITSIILIKSTYENNDQKNNHNTNDDWDYDWDDDTDNSKDIDDDWDDDIYDDDDDDDRYLDLPCTEYDPIPSGYVELFDGTIAPLCDVEDRDDLLDDSDWDWN